MPAGWTWPPAWRAPRATRLQPLPAAQRAGGNGVRSTAVAEPVGLPRAAARCDHRIAWQALLILQHHAVDTGDWVAAATACHAARDLAAAAGDDPRLAWSTAELAWLSARSDSIDAGTAAAAAGAAPGRSVRAIRCCWRGCKLAEARMAAQRDDLDGMRRLAEQALPLAQQAASPRLEAAVLTFLSDAYAKLGRPADALRAAERGLPIVRRHHDQRIELALTNNAGLAKIGLQRSAEGLQDLARVEELAVGRRPERAARAGAARVRRGAGRRRRRARRAGAVPPRARAQRRACCARTATPR